MASRSHAALTIAALLALAGCQHGGSNAIPAVSPESLLPSRETASFSVPQTAPAGIRTYVHLPLRNSADLDKLIAAQSSQDSPLYHHFLTPAQFRATYGPRLQDLETAASALQSQGFHTTLTSQGVIADAPQATVEKTFGIKLSPAHTLLSIGRQPDAIHQLSSNRAPVLPQSLKGVGAHVAAFAPLPQMQTNFNKSPNKSNEADNRYSMVGPYWFTDLKQAYQWPSHLVAHGTGRTIAILGVRDFSNSDAALYFGHEHLAVPTIVRRPVDGGPPPFSPMSGSSVEANLDVQQSGGAAPGATIMFYGAPDASIVPSFLDMYSAIVEDNRADVASASFSLCELFFTAPYNGGVDFTFLFEDFHDVFRQGNVQGITFVNSSGDRGAKSCANTAFTTAIFGVDFPNQDPDVTGVGGTNLVTVPSPNALRSKYVRENAYFDPIAPGPGVLSGAIWGSGGGISTYWNQPPFQIGVSGSSKRTVPDLSLQMGGCPTNAVQPCGRDRSASVVAFAGGLFAVIGTSASAPEFAGLQALQDERFHGRAGNANFLIYALAGTGTPGNGRPIFHSNIPGNNGYPTHHGYNYVVGNGTVVGSQYAFFPDGPFAGDPQTPSNP